MRKKTVLLILVLMFPLSALIATSSAQEREVGVNAGDWFRYSVFDVSWGSLDPNVTVPSYARMHIEELNKIEWVKVTVVSVIGTNLTAQAVIHFENGTEDAEDLWRDVDTGDKEGFIWFWSPIPANLNANDTAWRIEECIKCRHTINETVIRAYPDGARETNYMNITYEEDWNGSMNNYATAIFYWDRPTGVPVEVLYEQEGSSGEHLSWLVGITGSNIWIVPEFPTLPSTLFIFIILTVAIAFYKRAPG